MRASGLMVVLLVACGGPSAEPDAGTDAARPGGPDAGVSLSPVATATVPTFACPPGWSPTVIEDGPTVCDPFPGGRRDCAPDARQLPGDDGCVRIGPPCPPGDWADEEPAAGTVFVRPGATGGDGTRAAPFGTMTEAVAAAGDGDTVLLAAGTYEEDRASLERPVTIRGVCLDAVLGRGSSISVRTPGARIERVRMQGALRGPVVFSGDLTMREVAIRDTRELGVAAFDGELDLEDVSIRGTLAEGLIVSGAALRGRRVELAEYGVQGLQCNEATCTLEDFVLFDSRTDEPSGTISVAATATLEITRGYLEDQRDALVTVTGGLTLRDVVYRGATSPDVVDAPLLGLDGALTLERVWLDRHVIASVLVGGPRARVEARELVITDGAASPQGGGYGVFVTDGAEARFEGIWISRTSAAGLVASGAGTEVSAADVTVRRIQPAADGFLGRGLQVQLGARLEAERVDVRETPESGLIVSQGATAALTDLVVADIQARACAPMGCAPAGNGVAAYLGGALVLERFRISSVALAGLQLAMDLSDGEVFDNPVGVNLQEDGYDLRRLTTGVVYRANGVNLDAAAFAIPDPTPPAPPGL